MITNGLYAQNDIPTPEVSNPNQVEQVIAEDLIVQGSVAVGIDAVNGESFGFDTMRFKENNLRVHFDDTSSSGSFPNNDWRILINDSSNGGANYFAVEDATAARVPFKIEAGAPVNTLYVEADGDVGIKTANPVVDIHVVEGNTPTLRLEQDGSDGFTAQSWDVAGNETNFFIRDVTNGSKLPFKIKPGAPTNSIFISASGNIGVETQSPDANASMHLASTTKGFLMNKLTTTEATTLAASLNANDEGMLIYDTVNKGHYSWDGTQWRALAFAAGTGTTSSVPELFNYQSVVRDTNGDVIANQVVSFEISVLKNSVTGDAVFTEQHSVTTSDKGLVSFQIGGGTAVYKSFSNVSWGDDNYFLQVKLDATGGTTYVTIGTSQFVSVPYAIRAKYADNVSSTSPVFKQSKQNQEEANQEIEKLKAENKAIKEQLNSILKRLK